MKEIKCAELNLQTNTNTMTIINGQVQESKIAILSCPTCGNILFNLGNQIQTYQQAFDFLALNKDNILKTMKYCSRCGEEFTIPTLVEEAIVEEPIVEDVVVEEDKVKEEVVEGA